MGTLGIFVEAPLLIATLIPIVIYREKLADLFEKIPLPNFLVYLIASYPFMIVEENINCGAYGCGLNLWPWTLPYLFAFLIVFGILIRLLKSERTAWPLVAFSLYGLYNELFFGVASADFQALPMHWFIFFAIYIPLSYAYFAIVPFEILIRKNKKILAKKGADAKKHNKLIYTSLGILLLILSILDQNLIFAGVGVLMLILAYRAKNQLKAK